MGRPVLPFHEPVLRTAEVDPCGELCSCTAPSSSGCSTVVLLISTSIRRRDKHDGHAIAAETWAEIERALHSAVDDGDVEIERAEGIEVTSLIRSEDEKCDIRSEDPLQALGEQTIVTQNRDANRVHGNLKWLQRPQKQGGGILCSGLRMVNQQMCKFRTKSHRLIPRARAAHVCVFELVTMGRAS